jgi:hypothetical protein
MLSEERLSITPLYYSLCRKSESAAGHKRLPDEKQGDRLASSSSLRMLNGRFQ